MKKLLLLSLSSFFIFSCSEYSDDGTPSTDNVVITNPDGSKKVKKIEQTVIAENSMEGFFPGQDLNMVLTNEILTEYSQNSYSFTTTLNSSTDVSGLGDMGGGQDLDTNFTSTITNTVENGLTTEITSTEQAAGTTSTSRVTFGYDNNRLTSINNYENGALISNANLAYTTDNVTISKEYTDSEIGNETITLNLNGNTITGGTVQNANTSNDINFEIIRNDINVTQINLSSNTSSSTINYSYDSSVNFYNNLGNEMNETRMAGEVASLVNISYQPQDVGGQLDLFNLEAGIRSIAYLANNNLTQVTNNGDVIMSKTFTYDSDNYPISFSETSSPGDIMDFSTIFSGMRDLLISQFTAFGMSVEEATEQADMMIESLSNFDTNATVNNNGTIEYFE